jgi:hypothetical protein
MPGQADAGCGAVIGLLARGGERGGRGAAGLGQTQPRPGCPAGSQFRPEYRAVAEAMPCARPRSRARACAWAVLSCRRPWEGGTLVVAVA